MMPVFSYRYVTLPTREHMQMLASYLAGATGSFTAAGLTTDTMIQYMLDQWVVNTFDETMAQCMGVEPDAMPYFNAITDFLESSSAVMRDEGYRAEMKAAIRAVWDFMCWHVYPLIRSLPLTGPQLNNVSLHGWSNGDMVVAIGGVRR